eukprot:s48_g3.t1
MARGIIKHLKRMYAPKHWMLDKLRGRWAPKPNAGPHKLRECMPLIVMLRQRLKYALTYREVKMIVMQRLIKVDGKVRTDMFYPAGFMDVVQIEKTKENFRLLYNTKGRFVLHKVAKEEAAYKLCRVKRVTRGPRGTPYAVTHDGRTLRFPDPDVKANDTVRLDLETGKIMDHLKFEVGNTVMISGGNNIGRVGTITHREKHPGSFEIIHIKDTAGHSFNTRLENVFVIGQANKPWISLPKGNGVKLSIVEDSGALGQADPLSSRGNWRTTDFRSADGLHATAAAPLMVQGHGCACASASSGQSVVYLRPAIPLAGPAQHRMPVASVSRYTYTRPPVLDRSASGRSNASNIARQAIDSMQRTAFEALSMNVPTFNCKICFENLPLTERSTFMDIWAPRSGAYNDFWA